MKYICAIALIAAANAVKIQNEYPVWGAFTPPPEMDAVVKKGNSDFSDGEVEKAMKANPSNAGKFPVPDVAFSADDDIPKPHWVKQDWEMVVKKGNSEFNDKQVMKAEKLKNEPIRLPE